jgi:hypothetical protein
MALQLNNDTFINLWDLFDDHGESAWATALLPDGTLVEASVDPLAPDATDFATSSATGQRYARKRLVKIPGVNARLTVSTSVQTLQESPNVLPGVTKGADESDALTTGTFQGLPVTGDAWTEQFGHWGWQ